MKIFFLCFIVPLFFFSSCSPLRSSAKDEKYQMELSLHELQTGFDDLKHDFNCYQTELQILDSKIKNYENSLTDLKQNHVEIQQNTMDHLSKLIQKIERKVEMLSQAQINFETTIRKISSYSDETTAALKQYKKSIQTLEEQLASHYRKLEEMTQLKTALAELTTSLKEETFTYTVKSKDSLEKIAKAHNTTVKRIQQINHLDHDLIVIGQELQIPTK